MNFSFSIRSCQIGFRFLRLRYHPWIILTITPLKLLMASGIDRTHEEIRLMQAVGKINFAKFYSLLNDLLI